MKMFKLSELNSQESSGSLAGRRLSKALRVLSLPRLISERSYLPLPTRKVFSFDFSYISFFASLSLLKKRSEEKALRLQNPLLKMTKMKNQQTRAGKTLAIAAMTAVMAIIPPNMRKIIRRLTSWAKY
jgi:hypothetical protein